MSVSRLDEVPAVKTYLLRIGAKPRSLRMAVVSQHHGKYWKDLAIIRFAKDGTIELNTEAPEFAPTNAERDRIKEEFRSITWPTVKPLSRLVKMPPMMKNAKPAERFEFRNADGLIVLVQVRVENEEGEKAYIPFTYWSDDQWRIAEPEGPLPLYNVDRLKNASTVFIHEGAKAARHVQWMVDGETHEAREALKLHPWGIELSAAVHLGWIGGALSPERTDWTALAKAGVKRVYIVADNDAAGRSAIPKIAKQIRILTFSIVFNHEFPTSFDLADPFPSAMFAEQFYTGPTFFEMLGMATWATDMMPVGERGKLAPVLRDCFRDIWCWVQEIERFVCKEMPHIMRTENPLNIQLLPFSDAPSVARLIAKQYHGDVRRLAYRPDKTQRFITHNGGLAINLYVPSAIKSLPGDISQWMEFVEYLIPSERERKEVERWLATLIARPQIRIGYGLLLISKAQGIGKTTLGSHILAPLVGKWNCSWPTEAEINSEFTGWAAMKRLVIISEIYAGNNWKVYQSLKAIITDIDLRVNEKYEKPYQVDNWCHLFACSNSLRATKLEEDDRRWLIPTVAETPWPKEKFMELRDYVNRGGLGHIKHWAENYGDYVDEADRAPPTGRKADVIAASLSEAQIEVMVLAEALVGYPEPAALEMSQAKTWAARNVQGKLHDSELELRRTMEQAGVISLPGRLKIAGRNQYIVANQKLVDCLNDLSEDDRRSEIRRRLKNPDAIVEEKM